MMPAKNTEDCVEKEVEYCETLIKTIEAMPVVPNLPAVKEKLNLLKETMEDTKEELYQSKDEDAKIGHKTKDTSFFGYKTHIAMTPERIICAATVTSGEKPDGKQLPELVEKSRKNGVEVENVIGDSAYSGKNNLEVAEGFMRIGGEKINRIVATAFYGVPASEQYVVFHKNYNSQDNRAKNLSWVTKFEFKILQPSIQFQLRLLLGMKIESILSDISILQTIDVPNLNWMKSVTQAEADTCLQKYVDLKFSTPQEIEDLNWHTQSSKDVLKNLNPDYRESLTPNAVVVGNMIPSYFPCCPQEKNENPLQEYFTRLQPCNVYYMNSKYKVLVQQTAICEDKIIIKCESGDGENAIKPWSVSTITYDNGLYVHELYKTCFQEISADKYFTVLQGKEWTGGDVFDDYC